MCIICLEFNKRKDFFDAMQMLNYARQEPTSISLKHLVLLEQELIKFNENSENSSELKVKDIF